jgi:hypothetical protein
MSDWYVDNAAGGSNDGTTWADAWESFADITWGAGGVVAGDTLWISGGDGTTSKTYSEELTINGNGSSASTGTYIMIAAGQSTPHSGQVIISGVTNGIYTDGRKCFAISGAATGSTECNIRVTDNSGHGVSFIDSDQHIVEYVEVDNNGNGDPDSGFYWYGTGIPVDITYRYCKVHDNYQDAFRLLHSPHEDGSEHDKCKIHDCDIYNFHDDGFEVTIGGMSVYNCKIHDRILPHRGHPDAAQIYNNYYKFYNNEWYNIYNSADYDGAYISLYVIYYEQNGAENMGMTAGPTEFWCYNSIFYETTDYDSSVYDLEGICLALSVSAYPNVNGMYVFNNTLYGAAYAEAIDFWFYGPTHDNVQNCHCENNLVWNAAHDQHALSMTAGGATTDITYGSHGDSVDVVCDYNSYSGFASTQVTMGAAGSYNTSDWRDMMNTEDNGTTSVPGISTGDWKWTDPSAAIIGAGVNLYSYFTEDKDGTERPSVGPWTIGAYEYGGSNHVWAPFAMGSV